MNIELLANLTGFEKNDLEEAIEGKKLLGLGLELTRRCNLNCVYCYANSGKPLNNELKFYEIIKIIDEAILLGVKKIGIIGGGEPLLYNRLKELINYLFQNGMRISLFTNGVLLNQEWASFLYSKSVSIVQKLNSFNEKIQDELCSKKDTFKSIQSSINNLRRAGYPSKESKLSIETVILKENIEELPTLWRWARNNQITPIFEQLTPFGRGENIANCCSTEEIKKLFILLSKIDFEEFSIEWTPRPPFAGKRGCYHHYYALYITSTGDIQPCSGVTIKLGNIRENRIKNILNSKVITELRHVGDLVEGRCKNCLHGQCCYGCRGSAFQMLGNYLASDPQCWYS